MSGQKQHIQRHRFEPDVIIHEVVNRAEAVRIFLLGLFIGCVLGLFIGQAHSAGMTAPNTYVPSNVTITGGSINGVTSGTFDKRYAFSGADGLGTNKKVISGNYQILASDSGLEFDLYNASANYTLTLPLVGGKAPPGFNLLLGSSSSNGSLYLPASATIALYFPDQTGVGAGNSFFIPAILGGSTKIYEFNGNFRVETIGRTIVANAVNNNEAVALGQFGAQLTNSAEVTGLPSQFIEGVLSGTTPAAMASGSRIPITSINLTPGTWDVTASAQFSPAATTSVTVLQACISPSVAGLYYCYTDSTPYTNMTIDYGAVSARTFPAAVLNNLETIIIPTVRITVTTADTLYLTGSPTFSVSTMTAFGNLRARRIK